MSWIAQWLDHPLAHRIGSTLLHSLWQGAIVGGLFEVARFGLRRRSANSRYVTGCVALAGLFVAMILTFLIQAPAASSAVVHVSPTVHVSQKFTPPFDGGFLGFRHGG